MIKLYCKVNYDMIFNVIFEYFLIAISKAVILLFES